MNWKSILAAPWLPYVAPFATFLLLTQAEASIPGTAPTSWYPIAYAVKVAIVALVMWLCRSSWRDLDPWPRPVGQAMAVAVGLAVTAVWVGLDGRYPAIPYLSGERSAFDPNVLPSTGRAAFLGVRLLGLVVVVPIFEELFWRSFLMRWVIDPEFLKVPIGKVTPMAVGVTAVGFALAHPEWLPALLTGLAWAWLLWQTRSVSACVVSHMVANLALGIYVLATGEWKYW